MDLTVSSMSGFLFLEQIVVDTLRNINNKNVYSFTIKYLHLFLLGQVNQIDCKGVINSLHSHEWNP